MEGTLRGGAERKDVELASIATAVSSMMRGVTLPWPLAATALLGVWLMFTRVASGTESPMADSDAGSEQFCPIIERLGEADDSQKRGTP